MDTTKTKIINIQTGKAEKNVKSLKTQIRELKEQLAGLEKNTAEYDKVSKQLADTNQKQIEINEAMKFSNKDLGATLSNLTKVSAGVVGAISSINGVMTLMGADSEEAMEAMKRIQSLMAIIQGLSAIDTATKALKGLTVAFKGFNDVRVKTITTSLGASGAELAEAGALGENTKEMLSNNDIAKAYDKANKENARTTKEAADAIERETILLTQNRKVKSEGDTQINTHILDEYDSKLQHLRGEYEELSMHSEIWNEDMAKLSGQIDAVEKLSQNYALLNYRQKAYTESIGKGADVEQKALKELGEAQAILTSDFEKQLVSVRQRMDELDQLQDKLDDLYSLDSEEGVKVMEKFNQLNIDGVEYIDRMEDAESALNAEITKLATTELTLVDAQKDIIKYIPDQQLFDTVSKYNALKAEESEIDKRNEETYKALSKARHEMFEAEANGMEDAIEKERQYQEMQAAFNKTDDSKRLDEIYAELAGREELYTSYAKEIEVRKEKGVWTDVEAKQTKMATDAENANTAAIKGNTAAKKANADATEDVANEEKKLAQTTKKNDPILRKAWSGLTTGIKNAAKAIKSFVAANPVLATIAASAAVVAGAFALIAWQMRKSMEEMRAIVEFNNEVNHSYEEQQIRLNVLLNTARDETQTLIERKKATDELNKLIPNYNAELDETTGKYKENTNALNNYLDKLREKIELEAYEGRIKDLLQQRLELEQKLIKVQTSGWNIFGIRVHNIKNDIKDIDKEIDKLYGKINDLYLPWALDDNKPVTNGAKTVLKTFKDIIDSIKSMYADIWNTIFNEKELRITYNGVYRETDILFNNIERLIKSRNIQGLLSDEFKKAMSENFTEDMSFNITLDWVFDRAQQEKFYNELEKERISLEKMLSDKTKKYTDDEIKSQQDKVNGLKAEEESRKLVLEAVQKYFVQRRKEADETERLANAQENYNHQLEVEKKYINEQRRGDRDAEANKEIALGEYQIETIKQRMQYRKSEIDMLKSLPLQNEQVLSRIKELNAEQLEDQKKTDEELAKVDNAYYQKRLNHLEKENSLITANSEEEQRAEEIRRMLIGGGVVDYNTDVDLIGMQLKAIEQQKEKVNSYYETEKSKYAEDTEEWLRLEQERLEALDRLQEEYSKKDIERQMADADRKLAIQKAYIAAYQSISSQVSNILGEVMNSYDESSKEYLNLRYAQGVTDVLSGTLASYMSGIESGIPAPGNTILAAALAASTFAMGVAQLANIKSGTLSNAATAKTVNVGNEYDTLSYAQNAEILSNIQDQRIYVTEHDITTTQRRVQVQESNATF